MQFQKVTFCVVKGYLLKPKSLPFTTQKISFCKEPKCRACYILIMCMFKAHYFGKK